MNNISFDKYKQNYIEQAKEANMDSDIVNTQLEYAEKLFLKKLPVIYDRKHLSKLLGYNLKYIYSVCNSQEHFYRKFTVPKKNNKKRTIYEPLPNLKEIHTWILKEILGELKVNSHSKAYKKNSSIKDNAKFHKNQKKVLNIDIKNYFDSIKYNSVYLFFIKLGYYKSVSRVLANLCCLKGSLPQGASTSPMLSNLITENLDRRVSKYSKKNNLRYTRYADDITISGDFDADIVIKTIKNILEDEGFEVNSDKIYLRNKNQRQIVTGIVVNQKMQVPREKRNNLRLEMYYINKYGLEEHLRKNDIKDPYYLNRLMGRLYHIYNINPDDKKALEHIEKLKKVMKDLKSLS